MKKDCTYKFFAFISYSRKDADFAARLQKFMEHFKLPSRLCHQYPDKPKYLRPIYRDKTDLGIDLLADALQSGLDASKYLIVICSENSAKANDKGKNWVNQEVERFIASEPRKIDRIIPVMIRNNEGILPKNCYPPVIKALGLDSLDVLAKGEDRVFCEVVSRMLEIDNEVLWNQWTQNMRRRRLIRRLCMGSFIACLGGGSFFAWDFCVPKVRYYSDYVECNNLAKGVNELTEEETQARWFHYRFTEQYYKLQKVECCNSAGNVTDNHFQNVWMQRPVAMTYTYREDGTLAKCHHLDKLGNEYVTIEFPDTNTITWHKKNLKGREVGPGSASSTLTSLLPEDIANPLSHDRKAVVNQKKVKRNSSGAVIEELYYNAYGYPCFDSEGAAGCVITRDSQNRIVSMRYIDQARQEIATRKGIKGIQYTYDGAGNLASVTMNPAPGVDVPVVISRFTWENFNLVEEATYYSSGKRALNMHGCSYKKIEYDEKGNITEISCFDENDNPCVNIFGYSVEKLEYDDACRVVKITCFDIAGHPCMTNEGWSSVEHSYDSQGRLLKSSFYGENGKPCMSELGCAVIEYKYDNLNREFENIYYDEFGKMCSRDKGSARITMGYDDVGNVVEIASYGDDGMLCSTPLLGGAAKFALKYDLRGNITEYQCYGENGKPVENPSLGFSRMELQYDARGNVTQYKMYDKDGGIIFLESDCVSVVNEYNDSCHLIRETYVDALGNPCAIKGTNVASIVYENNSLGLAVKTLFFDVNGKPCLNEDGVAGWFSEYDVYRNETKRSYFDLNGQPCSCNNGYAVVKIVTNSQKTRQNLYYFDLNDEPTEDVNGVHCVKRVFNKMGVLVENAYYNKNDGETLQLIRGEFFAENGQITHAFNYPRDGSTASKEFFNELGQLVEIHFCDAQGKLVSSQEGYAIIYREYNEQGRLKAEGYFDVNNKPCVNRDGHHLYTYIYDGERISYIGAYDVNKKKVSHKVGLPPNKFWIHEPAESSPGLLAIVDENGILEVAYYANDNLVPCPFHLSLLGFDLVLSYARPLSKYPNGKVKELLYYNPQGGKEYKELRDEQMHITQGIVYANDKRHGAELNYDKNGSLILMKNIDINGNLCENSKGVAMVTFSYNPASKKCIRVDYHDIEGKIVKSEDY